MLSSLCSSSLFAFPSKQAQQSAAVIRAVVTNIHMKRQPVPLDSKCGNDVKACYEKMSNFCVHQILGGDGKPQVVYGKKALDLIHAGMEKKVDDSEDFTLADLHYGRFHWLLSDTQAEELKKWTRSLLPSWDGDLGEAADTDGGDMAKKTKQKIQEASVEQAVDDAFA